MSVFVPPGNHNQGGTATVSGLDLWGRPETPRPINSGLWRVGTKVTSTSRPLYVDGHKWSPMHSYTRAALACSRLGGGFRRGWSDKSCFVLGGMPDNGGQGPHPSQLTAVRNPYTSTYGVPYSLPTNLSNRLNTEILLKAGHRQWSVGEFLGESKQTLNHLAKTTEDLSSALISAYRGNWKQVAKSLKVRPKDLKGTGLTDRWLEYQYGWLPLMSDIFSAYKVFSAGLSRPQLIRCVRRISGGSFDLSNNSETSTNGLIDYTVEGKANLNAQAIGYWKLANPYLDYLQQLGLINPLEIAWNLQAYSFVVDWVLPIGNLLEASTATVGLTFVDGCITTKVTAKAKTTHKNSAVLGGAAGWPLLTSSPMYSTELFGLKRTPVTGFSALPYVKSPLSSSHVVSALALLRQLKR